MGLALTNADALGEDLLLPAGYGVRNGLVARKLFNTSLEKCAFNFAPGKPSDTIYGTPVLIEGGSAVRCKGLANFFQSQILETMAGTLIIGCRSLDTRADFEHRAAYWGTRLSPPRLDDGAEIEGVSFRDISASNVGYFNANRSTDGTYANQNSGQVAATWSDHTEWTMFTFEWDLVGKNRVIVNTQSDVTTYTNVEASMGRFPSTGFERWGSEFDSNEGECDLAFGVRWDRVLSAEEKAIEWALNRQYQLDKYSRPF